MTVDRLEPYISAEQAAREMHVRPATVREWLRSGEVPTAFMTPGGKFRVQRSGLRQFARRNKSVIRQQPGVAVE